MQKTVGAEDHPGGTEPALQGIVLHECLLQLMELSVILQSFDGDDLPVFDRFHGNLTGADRFVVDQHRAGAAISLSAAIFRSGQTEIGAQHS